jgi:hypothetical protein
MNNNNTEDIDMQDNKKQDLYQYQSQTSLSCAYYLDERHYLVKKYDIYTFLLYLYHLENKGMHLFYKSNEQILKDLDGCICKNTLNKAKQNLIDEKILIEKENIKGGTRKFYFRELKKEVKIKSHINKEIKVTRSSNDHPPIMKQSTPDHLMTTNNYNINKDKFNKMCANKSSNTSIDTPAIEEKHTPLSQYKEKPIEKDQSKYYSDVKKGMILTGYTGKITEEIVNLSEKLKDCIKSHFNGLAENKIIAPINWSNFEMDYNIDKTHDILRQIADKIKKYDFRVETYINWMMYLEKEEPRGFECLKNSSYIYGTMLKMLPQFENWLVKRQQGDIKKKIIEEEREKKKQQELKNDEIVKAEKQEYKKAYDALYLLSNEKQIEIDKMIDEMIKKQFGMLTNITNTAFNRDLCIFKLYKDGQLKEI